MNDTLPHDTSGCAASANTVRGCSGSTVERSRSHYIIGPLQKASGPRKKEKTAMSQFWDTHHKSCIWLLYLLDLTSCSRVETVGWQHPLLLLGQRRNPGRSSFSRRREQWQAKLPTTPTAQQGQRFFFRKQCIWGVISEIEVSQPFRVRVCFQHFVNDPSAGSPGSSEIKPNKWIRRCMSGPRH